MYSSQFYFLKQKTAYEMRISDWSSDVCSSDLWASSASASVIPVRPPPKIITSCCMTASVPLPVRSVQNYLGKRDGYGKQFSDGDDGDDRRRRRWLLRR